MQDMPYEHEHFTYDCPLHGALEDAVCCIPVRIQGRGTLLAVVPGSIKLEPQTALGQQE